MSDPTSGNGRRSGKATKTADWKAIAQALQEKLERLQAEVDAARLRPREATKLRNLEHFFSRVLNAQVGEEARKTLDGIIEETGWILKGSNDGGQETKQ